MSDITKRIFEPTKRDMRVEYPELTDVLEFNSLSNKDIKFIWYYACQSSPLVQSTMEDEMRMQNSAKLAYGTDFLLDKKVVNMLNGNISDDMVLAINKMKKFSPSIRTKANTMALSMFSTLEKITVIDEFEFTAMDFDDKKAFVSLAKTVSEVLPSLIDQIEKGFSVTKKTKANQDDDNENLMDFVIDSEEI